MKNGNSATIVNTDERAWGIYGGYLTLEFNKYKTHNGFGFVKYDNRRPCDTASHRTHYDNEKAYNNAIKRAQKQFKEFNP